VGLPLLKKKAVILGRKMKENVIRLRTWCAPSSSSDKGGNLLPTLRLNEPTVLDDHSAACGVILRRCLLQLLVSVWIKNTVHTYSVDKEVRVENKEDSTSYKHGIESTKRKLGRKRQ
jgi:hypothetical protein